jgi:hypothetical protein
MKKLSLRIAVVFILAMSFIFPISGASLAASSSLGTGITDVWDLQKMPVIYDGTRYTADEFNNMSDNLKVAVYFPDKSTGEKLLYVFSNTEDFTEQFKIKIPDAKALENNSNGSGSTLLDLDPGYGYNWVHINRGGNCLMVPAGTSVNLSSAWNNVISSVEYPYYSGYTYGYMLLCGGTDYAQPFFFVPIGGYVPNLVNEEFNDVTSSITWA